MSRRVHRAPRAGRGLLAALSVAVLALAGCASSSSGSTGSSASATSPASATSSVSAASPGSSAPPGASARGGGTSSAAAAPAGAAPAAGNVYAAAGAGALAPAAAAAKPMIYVPNSESNTVTEIDPSTYQVVRRFATGAVPQHVVPSWDLKTLWVNVNSGNTLVPIDARTGVPGRPVPVVDPYNLYFTPDGAHALVMAEAEQRIDVRDPHTMALQRSLKVPCRGVNHADYTADLSTLVVSCEFSGELLVIPADLSRVAKVLDLTAVATPGGTSAHVRGGVAHQVDQGVNAMPQDVRLTPDGRTFLVADMLRNGVWLVDAATFAIRGFLPTGAGAHGIYPSRDARSIYVSNRDEGSVSVLDAATLTVRARWTIPGGGSPDMGGVSADGSRLWLSGRYHGVVYEFDTATGKLLRTIPTGRGPHGLAVWPQPGRFSLGHTGNLR